MKKKTRTELANKYLDKLLDVRKKLENGDYDAAHTFTEKAYLLLMDQLLTEVITDL